MARFIGTGRLIGSKAALQLAEIRLARKIATRGEGRGTEEASLTPSSKPTPPQAAAPEVEGAHAAKPS